MSQRPKVSDPFKLVATADGLQIADTLLWLDAKQGKALSFLSHCPFQGKKITSQILATEETIGRLGFFQKGIKALSCQYRRPFSIGSLSLELFPIGPSGGSAALLVKQKGASLLYISQIGAGDTEWIEALPQVNQVVVGAHCPNPKVTSVDFDTEWQRFLLHVEGVLAAQASPVILVPELELTQKLLQALDGLDVVVQSHPRFEKFHGFGSHALGLGSKRTRGSRRRAEIQVIPFPTSRQKIPLSSPEHPVVMLVQEGVSPKFRPIAGETVFHFSGFCNKTCKQMFKQTNPERIYFAGPYALRYAKVFSRCAPVVAPLFVNQQPSLF